jgi:hypothetical protein
MADQDAMRAIGGAIAQLAANPYRRKPSTGATTTGCASAAYRVVYMIEGDLVTIERVDRVA